MSSGRSGDLQARPVGIEYAASVLPDSPSVVGHLRPIHDQQIELLFGIAAEEARGHGMPLEIDGPERPRDGISAEAHGKRRPPELRPANSSDDSSLELHRGRHRTGAIADVDTVAALSMTREEQKRSPNRRQRLRGDHRVKERCCIRPPIEVGGGQGEHPAGLEQFREASDFKIHTAIISKTAAGFGAMLVASRNNNPIDR